MKEDNRPYNILIIEDNPGDYFLIEEFIGERIHEAKITHAVNFKEAIHQLFEMHNSFDIVLMDLTLPDKSGEDLVTEMLRLLPGCPIVILTGFGDISFSIKSIARGISDYLLKDELNAGMLYKSIIYSIERKKSVELIKHSEKRYSDLFNLSPQPMWVYEILTLKFVQVNKAAIDLYEFSEAEFLNMTIMDIRHKDQHAKTTLELKKSEEENYNSIYTGSFNHLKKDGKIISVEIYSTALIVNKKKCRSVIAVDVTERNEYEHAITKAIIKTQEDERYEIGGELHDNVCQILATSMISLSLMKKYIEPAADEWYNNTKRYINMASDEIRNLSHRLAPAFFEDSNFEVAIEVLLHSFNLANEYEINIDFEDNFNDNDLSLDLKLNLYRIVQEQLRNIMKYAKATVLEFQFYTDNKILYLKLKDNGVGFNIEIQKYGIGIANMKRRTELFSGTFEIESAPGKGCKIMVTIPLETNQINP